MREPLLAGKRDHWVTGGYHKISLLLVALSDARLKCSRFETEWKEYERENGTCEQDQIRFAFHFCFFESEVLLKPRLEANKHACRSQPNLSRPA